MTQTPKTMNKVAIQPKNRAHWESMRSEFLGGSEIASILGINPYQSAFDLWQLKTGKVGKQEMNRAMNFGHLLEQSVADQFEKETGHRVIKSSADDVIYLHKDYHFLGGTPDRFYFPKEKDGRRILECKTTARQIDEIPEYWFTQVQFYLGLTNITSGSIAWLSAKFGFSFDYMDINFDAELFEIMVQAAHEFWTENVQKDIPPAAQTSRDIERMYKSHTQGKVIEIDDNIYKLHNDLKALKEAEKETKAKITEIEEQIKLQYDDAEAMSFSGKVISTWKTAKPSQRFDKKSFSNDYPELSEKYTVTGDASRRLLLKIN